MTHETRKTSERRRREPRRGAHRSLAVMVASLLFAACATSYLVPAPDARRPYPGSHAVVEERAGIQVVADPRAWNEPIEVLDEVVPIWVSVTNRSDRRVYVSPTDVHLVGDGKRVRAELPTALDPEPLPTTIGMEPTMFDDRASVVSDQIVERSERSRLRYEMQQRGFRNRELDPGEREQGFVYFEKTSWDETRVELEVVLRDESGNRPVLAIQLPFLIIKG